jgi:molybdopterin-containing oxidoreductase family iron-sulfur binding subunit
VCPTQATWKREDGIVMMDMHRCIGCRYCIVGCPYGSRSFNWRDPRPNLKRDENGEPVTNPDFPTRTKGVVEKCNFCADRMAKGEKTPSCVAQCPHGALVFGDVNDPNSEVRKILREQYTLRRKVSLGTKPHVFYIL